MSAHSRAHSCMAIRLISPGENKRVLAVDALGNREAVRFDVVYFKSVRLCLRSTWWTRVKGDI